MTRHWFGKPALAMAALLMASAVALPTGASAHDRYERGWHGGRHYDRGWHDRGRYDHHYRYDRGHWSGGRWVAGAIVAGAVIGLVDDALRPPPRVVYERPVYRRPVRVVYEEPVVTRRVVETRTVYVEQAPPTRYVGYYGD
ncbi:hypothetical protein [Frateuria soli]|uniref:hypothetical protein n=1 Tax=Frateuria soli TaxID=1542730 RepID=UPI001E37B273|nr:hypothetical protein [Frateuria soli]UGB38857.1 hypothetical protein LQ771_03095 [Frateuria soli]